MGHSSLKAAFKEVGKGFSSSIGEEPSPKACCLKQAFGWVKRVMGIFATLFLTLCRPLIERSKQLLTLSAGQMTLQIFLTVSRGQ